MRGRIGLGLRGSLFRRGQYKGAYMGVYMGGYIGGYRGGGMGVSSYSVGSAYAYALSIVIIILPHHL